MRRLLAILLLPIYLVATGGMAVARHYCAGELQAVSILGNVHCCCADQCNTQITPIQQNDCCSDEVTYFKAIEDQEKENTLQKSYKSPCSINTVQISVLAYAIPHFVTNTAKQLCIRSRGRPNEDQDLFIIYCQQKLYDNTLV